MPDSKLYRSFGPLSVVAFFLLAGGQQRGYAQSALPAQTTIASAEPAPLAEPTQIVSGRPKLHTAKRVLHPFTWIHWGLRPIVRLGDNALPKPDEGPPPGTTRTKGVKFGIDLAGGGSGIGPKVTPFYKHSSGAEFELPLLFTYRHYEVYRFDSIVPLGSDRRYFESSIGYASRPMDLFFGLGNDTQISNKTTVRSISRSIDLGYSQRIGQQWKTGAQISYKNVGVTKPRYDGTPSALQVFGRGTIPALHTGAEVGSLGLSIQRDTRDLKLAPTTGGIERFEISMNEGIHQSDIGYWKYRLDVQRYLPLSAGHGKILVLRAMVETNQEKGGGQVPFFDMARLGGADTLRGFDEYRFYDASAMTLSVEYRYRIWRVLDWALFLDEGQVGPELGDFAPNRFHTGYGARLMLKPTSKWSAAISAGHSREGWRLYLTWNKASKWL